MAEFDLEGARKAGVGDAEIADTLAPKLNYDIEGARKAGISDSEIASALAEKFNSTQTTEVTKPWQADRITNNGPYGTGLLFQNTEGGAATGNPSIQRQGSKAYKGDVSTLGKMGEIAGSGAIGGALGAFGSEITGAAGRGISVLPMPGARVIGAGLEAASGAMKAGGRLAPAIAGTISGLASESAGQIAEGQGASPATAEAIRFVAGAAGAETANIAKQVLQAYVVKPSLSLISYGKKMLAKSALDKLDSAPQTLTEQEKAFINSELAALRGGDATGAPTQELSNIGSIMGAEGKRLMTSADTQMIDALRKQGQIGGVSGYPSSASNLSDIGEQIRAAVLPRFEALDTAQKTAYKETQAIRDSIVKARESSGLGGQWVSQSPEFGSLVSEIQGQLNNVKAMNRSPDIQSSYQRILNDLVNSEKDVFGNPKPTSFQALDDVRRKLGEAFAGKPPEGYGAIEKTAARDLYGKISEIQKNFVGGENGPQAKLLADYAADIPGLQQFTSKIGKRVTGLDQYREGVYSTDAKDIPAVFFKSKQSIMDLKNMLGSTAKVENAALAYADHSLAGMDSAQARKWMGKNAEWLGQTSTTRRLVDNYVTRLEGAERSFKNAQEFAKQAEKDAAMLIGKGIPEQRAIDLIRSGDAQFWDKVAPVIAQSPTAKKDMVMAVRQTVADMPNTEATSMFFNTNIRPFLEKANIATKQEMDFISGKLKNIMEMNIPEKEKLGHIKTLILGGTAGWLGSAISRTGFKSMVWAIPQ